MNGFFAKDFSGGPFVLFSLEHWIGMTALVIIGATIIVKQRTASDNAKIQMRWFLAILLILNELGWQAWNFFTEQWTIQTMLPFHLCSILVPLCAYMLITKDRYIYEFAYLIGIAGAIQAILTPNIGQYGFPHFLFFQVHISHGIIIISALYMTFVEGYRPTWDSVKRVILYGNLYLLTIFGLNLLIGSNYLFIAHKPETASLLDLLPPWPYYIAIIEGLGLMFIFLFYAPFAIADWRKGKNPVSEPS